MITLRENTKKRQRKMIAEEEQPGIESCYRTSLEDKTSKAESELGLFGSASLPISLAS